MKIEPSLFVFTSAIDEEDLRETVATAYDKAEHPERVYFGIVEQSYRHRFTNFKHWPLVKALQITYAQPAPQPMGLGLGRMMALLLHEHQDYCLQIDAHTIFDDNWDSILINDLNETGDPKAVLSQRPNWYYYEDGKRKFSDSSNHGGLEIAPGSFGYEMIAHSIPAGHEGKFVQHYMVSGAFIFSRLECFTGSMPDPRIPFGGEEHVFAMRICSRGWHIYACPRTPLWSAGRTEERPALWKESNTKTVSGKDPAIDFYKIMEDPAGIVKKILDGEELGYWGARDLNRYNEYIAKLGFSYRDN